MSRRCPWWPLLALAGLSGCVSDATLDTWFGADEGAEAATTEATAAPVEGALSFDDLTETEKSAASIGVSPDEWKPIGFMNAHHYSTLLKNNAISGDLAQGIEAYKQVAGGLSQVA